MKSQVLLIMLSLCITYSCKKNEFNTKASFNPISLIIQEITCDENHDFEVFTSSSLNSSVLHTSQLDGFGISVVQFDSRNNDYIGPFHVNNENLSFESDPGYYTTIYDSVGPHSYQSIVGNNNLYSLNGSAHGAIDFSIEKYKPENSFINISGLDSNRALSRNTNITLTWNHDSNLPTNSKTIVAAYSKSTSDPSQYITKYVLVNDSDESHVFTSDFLSDFQGESFDILLARGYCDLELIDNKKVLFTFFGYTSLTIYFDDASIFRFD